MKTCYLAGIGAGIMAALGLVVLAAAGTFSETEPNNTPATANPLAPGDTVTGAISPIGDQDYFSIPGVNTTWGFIALLDTSASGTSAELDALRSDGTTVMQSDVGSWVKGSGIALQGFVDGGATHYLRVHKKGDNATVASYSLRYYQTIVTTQPEVEPNDTRLTGTPSSFTMSGTISSASDVDCYAFQGRSGDTILLALKGDPEGDGSPIDPALKLVSPTDAVLASADQTGVGGNEFIEYGPLASSGVYAYCVWASHGTGGPTATYKVGLVRNGHLYLPDYTSNATWTNPRPGNYALVGDLLTFDLSAQNTSPLKIPGNIGMSAEYNSSCLDYVSSNPVASSVSPGEVSWDGQKPGGLNPGETYTVSLTTRARHGCQESLHQNFSLDYFFSGVGSDAPYKIWWNAYLPAILKAFP